MCCRMCLPAIPAAWRGVPPLGLNRVYRDMARNSAHGSSTPPPRSSKSKVSKILTRQPFRHGSDRRNRNGSSLLYDLGDAGARDTPRRARRRRSRRNRKADTEPLGGTAENNIVRGEEH